MTRLLRLGGLGLVLTAAVGCSGSHAPTAGGGTASTVGPADAQTFTISGTDRDQFSPQTVLARVGRLTLTLHNGGVPHNLTFSSAGLPGIGTVSGAATKSVTLTFSTPGTFTFGCTIHPGMVGKLVVSG